MSVSPDQLDSLQKLATRFRRSIEACRARLPMGYRSPNGACLDASLLLGHHLKRTSVGNATYVRGTKDRWTHAWLEMDGVIISPLINAAIPHQLSGLPLTQPVTVNLKYTKIRGT